MISPSQKNGLVGIRPTVGLVSRHLVVPISVRQDTVGPLARSVKDAAYVLEAIAGKDQRDNYTSAIPFRTIPKYSAACMHGGLKGKRIGVPRNVLDSQLPSFVEQFNTALDVMRQAGATIIDDANFTALNEYDQSEVPELVMGADGLANIEEYMSELTVNPYNLSKLADIRDFTRKFPLEEYPYRDTGTWDRTIETGIYNTDPRFWPLYQENLRMAGPGGILGALKNYKLDALVMPAEDSYNFPCIIGSPVVSVPLGAWPEGTNITKPYRLPWTAPGIPIGIGFAGDFWTEEELIGMAYDFEQRTRARDNLKHYPGSEPTVDLQDILDNKKKG